MIQDGGWLGALGGLFSLARSSSPYNSKKCCRSPRDAGIQKAIAGGVCMGPIKNLRCVLILMRDILQVIAALDG